ncbi:MAG: hypothetical protein ABL912_01815 [Novosphingobium sp.]
MASTAQADVAAALSLVMRPRIESQINNVAVLPYILPITRGEGKSVNWTAKFTGAANATASTEGVARSSTDADDEISVPATLPWAQYDKTSSVTDLAQAAAGSNYNPESIQAIGNDLLAGLAGDQAMRLALGIATDCYAGNDGASPPQLAGAARIIDSSGTVCGINPSTFTEWASVEDTGALAAVTFDVVRNWFTNIYNACGMMPEFVTCPSNVFNALRALYSDFDPSVREVSTSRGGGMDGREPRAVKLAAGMRAIEIDQVPFVLDRHCTANTMYAWNTQFVEIQQLDPLASLLAQGPEGLNDLFSRIAGRTVTLPRQDIEGMMARSAGLRPHLNLLGKRGLSNEANIAVFAQFKWSRRNAFGKYTFA